MSDPKAKYAVSDSSTQDCYCGLWTTSPAYLREQGIAEGFFGVAFLTGTTVTLASAELQAKEQPTDELFSLPDQVD